MDFNLSEEQRLIQETTYRFALQEIEPVAKQYDREEKYPREIVKKARETGLVGAFIPDQYGGPGYGFLEVALISEQLARVDLGINVCIMTATFGSENILFNGTEEQKRTYLPPLVNEDVIAAGAYTEPNAGTDVAGTRTRAVRQGNEYVINGNKMFITNGTVCDWMVVLCVTGDDEAKKHGRHSLILVESDRKGITANKIRGKLGIRASDTAEIAFEDVRVPCENLIGKEGQGFYHVMHFFDATRTMVAGQGVGIAQGALDKTVRYVKERTVFGRPLAVNQGVQFQLAEMATRIELARTLTYRAAWKVDQGEIDPALNAMAKYFSGEMAVWVCDKALQLHGGYGYIDEYDVQRFYRDAKILEIYEGAKEAEKLTISRRLL
ncbi:MAG: acyl-CoA dehydrogenase [Deltaproteobacteria bacterium CG_4_8_14_3_um_filter_51_11]|nr:acyl-CoA dehydrogenase [bacterium]OIP38212.1 MAG: acyl-CoA dehydrogenase [Desulfobacteraceae bacterium CG2_30_51_40]PIP48627.1 MAG: acyl-CoA dehydrogenase [Deltaproteobacteria bacterium CG23_combo_of_CG06-09_8_20_14_all_51_20]PIX19766.1 MAG: acyl-CoA dehydrogenase [Deltaproteobacteria bacterium CG_4_8_14_3_um_filter_51_11]PIY26201.1 MAG: acyl-CoA dehydrogenase [Deltaproteobacteria bacterium CG_4_10_14_3_um_filter_51_14]PJB35118.1 MAG: acyl-CoA dehydrogenase [Deltaproteobacteria bacterium CG